MKRITDLSSTGLPRLHEEQAQQDRRELQDPGPGGDRSVPTQHINSGKGRFLRLFFDGAGNRPRAAGTGTARNDRPPVSPESRPGFDFLKGTRKAPIAVNHRPSVDDLLSDGTFGGVRPGFDFLKATRKTPEIVNPDSPIADKPIDNGIAAQPYVPIRVQRYSSCGAQRQAAVACTDYARQAAEMLIDKDGCLDTRHAVNMMIDVSHNPDLPEHFRNHVVRTLKNLEENAELAATINGTCASCAPSGPAADAVRATLNLPPSHSIVSPTDARKAVVMSLLGNLRQGAMGDCFAVGPAICLHADSPGIVAKDLKQMLEENALTVNRGSSRSKAPFNKYFSRMEAQVKLSVRADGRCYGIAARGANQSEFNLHETPGMRAALSALGVPDDVMEYEVGAALYQMSLRDGGRREVSCKEVIEHIARNNRADNTDPDRRIGKALHAFSGQESVALLRAWEYTMAAAGASANNKKQIGGLISATLYGTQAAGRDPQSLAEKNVALQRELIGDPRFARVPVGRISVDFFERMSSVMNTAFCRLYDPDIEKNRVSEDGVSTRGGWALYRRMPRNDPTQWRRIDSEEMFRQSMIDAVEEAHRKMAEGTDHYELIPGQNEPQANRDALRRIADDMIKHIRADGYIEHAADSLKPGSRLADPSNRVLWEDASGGYESGIVRNYGGERVLNVDITAPDDVAAAHEAVKFMCTGLSRMRTELQVKRAESHEGFRIPIGNKWHAFTMLPQSMEDVWLHDDATPEQWIDNALRKPAMSHVEALRTQPPLFKILQWVSTAIGADKRQAADIYRAIARHSPALSNLDQPYSLSRVHRELARHCGTQVNGDEMLINAEKILAQNAPVPARIVADTNWEEVSGNPTYMGALYNPYRGRVELQLMDGNGGNRRSRNDQWLSGRWDLYSPLATRPDDLARA